MINALPPVGAPLERSLRAAVPVDGSVIVHHRVQFCLEAFPSDAGEVINEVFAYIEVHKELVLLGVVYTGKEALKKLLSIVAEQTTNWLLKRRSKSKHIVYIFGPNEEVLKVIEVKDGEAKTTTARWRRKVAFPFFFRK